MIAEITPAYISGRILAPASKSSMQRAVAAALLSDGISTLYRPSFSDDSLASLEMAECLGAEVTREPDRWVVKGGLKPVCHRLNCGESGLGIRMFSAIAALTEDEFMLTGRGTILNRPMDMLVDGLQKLGVSVNSEKGKLPFTIRGPIQGGKINIDGSESSQFISGLLMALPLLDKDSVLEIDALKSKPYIDLTISVLKEFGIEIINNDYRKISIPGKQKYKPANYYVEEDWSGIAFIAVAGAISGKVIIEGVTQSSVQADRRILDVLKLSGTNINFSGKTLSIEKSDLHAFEYDITDCPDLAPPLVALASFCKGRSILNGTSRLIRKESNRSLTLTEEFSNLGVDIRQSDNTIEIVGRDSVSGGIFRSHGDHRIAMALTVAATRAESPMLVEGAEAVNKSYPDFFEDMRKLGLIIKTVN